MERAGVAVFFQQTRMMTIICGLISHQGSQQKYPREFVEVIIQPNPRELGEMPMAWKQQQSSVSESADVYDVYGRYWQ